MEDRMILMSEADDLWLTEEECEELGLPMPEDDYDSILTFDDYNEVL